MNVKQIYERVSVVMPVFQRQFFDRLNDTVVELGGMYGEVPKLLYVENDDGTFAGSSCEPFDIWVTELEDELSIETEVSILPLYHAAIVDNILFLSGAGEHYKGEFIRKAREAWLKYWNVDAKDRRVKSNGKGGCCRV